MNPVRGNKAMIIDDTMKLNNKKATADNRLATVLYG